MIRRPKSCIGRTALGRTGRSATPTYFRCAPKISSASVPLPILWPSRQIPTGRRLWPAKGSCMKAPDSRARWEAVNRWLEVAGVDRNAAEALRAVPSLRPSAPFHCQQALEKLLKGILTLAGKRGAKTHELDRLGTAAARSFPEIEELVAAAKNWSDWAFIYRYPSDKAPPVPDENELRRALDVIDKLASRLTAANPEPPGS